ncbi:hypothetical protein M5689_020562 [Euphorbia peplus]|nr:hypothetical protein M5689_020562 [Euphorbia peplus]
MKTLSWNVQGLGNPWTVRTLRKLVRENCPNIIFLMETRLKKNEFRVVEQVLGEFHVFVVNAVGLSGGLIFAWRKEVDVLIINYSNHCVSFLLRENDVAVWRGLAVYGWSEQQLKKLTWELINHFCTLGTLPMLCFGDFNEISFSSEKKGGRLRDNIEMARFHDCLSSNDLCDVDADNFGFTWYNRRSGDGDIWEKLDRFLATPEWLHLFPSVSVSCLLRESSDHNPIILETEGKTCRGGSRRKIFRFEQMWTRDTRCRQVIESI